jgi:hypothetical protein
MLRSSISISSFENDDDFLECMPQKVRSTNFFILSSNKGVAAMAASNDHCLVYNNFVGIQFLDNEFYFGIFDKISQKHRQQRWHYCRNYAT